MDTLDKRHISRKYNTLTDYFREPIIIAYKDRIVVKRGINEKYSAVSRKGGGRRGQITTCTKQSRMNFRHAVQQISSLSTHIILTFPSRFSPDNHTDTRDSWDRMRRWLNKRTGGIYMYEFQKNGSVHMHILCNKWVDKSELKAKWFKVVGSHDKNHLRYGAKIEAIHDLDEMISYLAKVEQKEVPEGYVGMGRFWATFGKYEKIEPMVYQGNTPTNQRRIRAIYKVKFANCRKRKVRCQKNNGRFGFTLMTRNVSAITSDLDRM